MCIAKNSIKTLNYCIFLVFGRYYKPVLLQMSSRKRAHSDLTSPNAKRAKDEPKKVCGWRYWPLFQNAKLANHARC
jgi:hypothetical protein